MTDVKLIKASTQSSLLMLNIDTFESFQRTQISKRRVKDVKRKYWVLKEENIFWMLLRHLLEVYVA